MRRKRIAKQLILKTSVHQSIVLVCAPEPKISVNAVSTDGLMEGEEVNVSCTSHPPADGYRLYFLKVRPKSKVGLTLLNP